AQQGHLAPLSPTYAPDPIELEHRVPVYVPEPVKDLEDDPIDYVVDVNDDKDEEESFKDEGDEEEHLDLANSTAVASPAIDLIPSPPLPLPSLPTYASLTYAEAPMGYRAAGIRLRAASPLPLPIPSTSSRADIPKADIPPRKRILLTAPTPRFEAGESSTAVARQTRSTVSRRVDYSFVDTVGA
ncbi:hypothetical protein Tco_0187931, partial [Tanacetum coccineum]